MLPSSPAGGSNSAPVITLLTLIVLGAMAFAVPETPITAKDGEKTRGYIVGHGQFSAGMAELMARQGYTLLVLSLDSARIGKDALWVDHLDKVARRRFPVWGLLDPTQSITPAADLLRALNLGGVLVHGKDAVAQAAALRQVRPGLAVIPVVPFGSPTPTEGKFAVAMDHATFAAHANEVEMPLLTAESIGFDRIDGARANVTGDYFVSRVGLE